MTISNRQLESYLDELLNSKQIKDYSPNGLQVEGQETITKVVTGVTASEALIDEAIAQGAHAILVHHGYFWKGEDSTIKGLKRNRLKKLLSHDINLFGYHLPVDIHPQFGNNAQLANKLGIGSIEAVKHVSPEGVLMRGTLHSPMTTDELGNLLTSELNRVPLINSVRNKAIKTLAWCTGGGQGYIDEAADLGVDAFLTGEVSEQTIHSSREYKIDFIAAGHHATERYGIKAVGEHISEALGLNVTFIDIDNPA